MSTSQVDICNKALGNIGISQFMNSMDEQSNEALVCNRFYNVALDRVLAEYPWRFATKTVALADVGTPPDRWAYRYRYPSDCIQVLYVDNEETAYEVIADTDNDALAICSDAVEAEVTYVARVTQTRLYSPLFVDALAWSLAIDIAAPLAANPGIINTLDRAYHTAVSKAAARSMNENYKQSDYISELILERL